MANNKPRFQYETEEVIKFTETNKVEAPQNYIYISHMDEKYQYWRLPVYPDSISDTMESTFTTTNALGRSAPVYTFSSAGPRTVQIELKLHRDMMDDINMNWSNADLGYGEDYVDSLIKALQAIALPKYNLNNKAVEPPLLALRFGREIFIKGVLTSSVGVTYTKPILSNEKYAQVDVSFSVSEVDPYDNTSVFNNGSFRGMVNTFREGAKTIGIDEDSKGVR